MAAARALLVWKLRARRDETATANRRIWESECGRYQVVESKSKISGIPTRFYAMNGMTTILNSHTTKGPAFKTCDTHARQNQTPDDPKPAATGKSKSVQLPTGRARRSAPFSD